MLEFITKSLVLVLGYAYPALECYKTVEKNKVHIDELRYWCQYWIIAALLTILERVGDTFISWVPMYGEFKLGLFIYLWYPKTKRASYLYESLLRPFVSEHETDIETKLLYLRARVWDLAIFYWKNCTEMGQEAFSKTLNFLADQSEKISENSSKKSGKSFFSRPNKQKMAKD